MARFKERGEYKQWRGIEKREDLGRSRQEEKNDRYNISKSIITMRDTL